MSKVSGNIGRWLRAAALAAVGMQGLIGLILLAIAVGILWRPAGALLVVGILLALEEVCAALRGSRGA